MKATPILTLAMLLGACGGSPATGDEATNASPVVAPSPAVTPAPPPAPAAEASVTSVENDEYQFKYSYPAAAAATAPLAKWLDEDRARARAELEKGATEDQVAAREGGYDYRPHSSETEWKVVTDTPRLLSLSGSGYVYTGGAHGTPFSRAAVWDKAGDKRLNPTDLFVSPAVIQSAIGEEFCRLLDIEREKRRGSPVVRSDDSFNGCPKVEEATLILGSTSGRAIDRIGLLVDPYVAGPYAEGSFEATLPLTGKLADAVKPEYRDAFATR